MLYANGLPIEHESNKWLYEVYEKKLERLEAASRSKDSFAVMFRVRPDRVITQYTTDNREVNTTADEFVRFVSVVQEKDSRGRSKNVQWIYSPEPLPEENGKVNPSDAAIGRWMFRQDAVFETITDPELAFFLYHCHPKFGEAENNALYQLVDTRNESKKKVESGEQEAEFKYILYGRQSPLRQEREKLETVARAWGIENVTDKEDELILTELEDAVIGGENRKRAGNSYERGIKEFLDDVNVNDFVKAMAIVQQAMDEGVIGMNQKPSQLGIYWLDPMGNYAEKIKGLTLRTKGNYRANLAEYLIQNNNKHILNSLEEELGLSEGDDSEDQNEFDPYEILDNWDDPDYKSYVYKLCKENGIQVTGKGRTRQAWKEDMIELWKQQGILPEDYEGDKTSDDE